MKEKFEASSGVPSSDASSLDVPSLDEASRDASNDAAAFLYTLGGRAHEAALVSTGDIVFSDEVRRACEVNTCGNYNTNWTCPPVIGSLAQLKEKITAYQRALVFTTKYDLEDSFDYEGMVKAKGIHDGLTTEMHEKFGKTNPVFGAGGCGICKPCAYPAPCRFPERIFFSIESAGINVTELSRTAGVKYNNGPNTVTFFSMILLNGE
jgi:predicted metal-binding protein